MNAIERRTDFGGFPTFGGRRFRILIVSDAWHPQVNGVVRTLEYLKRDAHLFGAEIVLLTPDLFRTVGLPGYREIRLALAGPGAVAQVIEQMAPDAIHIATEGPLGFMTRLYCLRRRRAFTTCYHTRFPEYLAARAPVPLRWSYSVLRRFHAAAAATLVATEGLRDELQAQGFANLKVWKRGIDVDLFRSGRRKDFGLQRPIFLNVGRVSVEKNIEAFLALDLPGTKVVVGDGPAREGLMKLYPDARFPGPLSGQALADVYASADVFVFPSRTDTFGLVMLEALAAGTPVAAFPVAGPRDVLRGADCAVMSEDLRAASLSALDIPRELCADFASTHGMDVSAASFFGHVADAMELPKGGAHMFRRPAA